MNAETPGPPAGWVTVAQAAELLTRAGDRIDASNVSRYLARYPWVARAKSGVPSQRHGKFRYVDVAALKAHRNANVLVAEKHDARGLDPAPKPESHAIADQVDDLDDREAPSEIQQANLDLRRLQIQEKKLLLDEKVGALVPAGEVLALINGIMQSFVGALESEEVSMVQQYGREVGASFRRARKAAQARAATRLAELARKHLPSALAAQAPASAMAETRSTD